MKYILLIATALSFTGCATWDRTFSDINFKSARSGDGTTERLSRDAFAEMDRKDKDFMKRPQVDYDEVLVVGQGR